MHSSSKIEFHRSFPETLTRLCHAQTDDRQTPALPSCDVQAKSFDPGYISSKHQEPAHDVPHLRLP